MIPKECKRLAEVDFPIAEVSRHAVREKSIRHGHPSTLHLWWARRPLASSRAVLLALLLPDPCDPSCPEPFRQRAREVLLAMTERPSGWDKQVSTDEGLRRVILRFIADFANWDNASNSSYLKASRSLVQAAYPEETPLVVDPFAGGGSIPLEGLRIGCETFASDLNPVACLILKVMLEDIPRHGRDIAEKVRRIGAEVSREADRNLADLYPNDSDGASPIAYLWARMVRCEAPNCGAEMPLMRTNWLCRKKNRKRALRATINRCSGEAPRVEFDIFEPAVDADVLDGTVSRAKATCVCCGSVLMPERVRAQLALQKGGADTVFDSDGTRIGGARMIAVVTLKPGEVGRHYRLPTGSDYAAVRLAQERISSVLSEWEFREGQPLCPVPDEPTPAKGRHRAVGSQLPLYNMTTFGDLFTARQKVALIELTGQIRESAGYDRISNDVLGLIPSKLSDRCNSLVNWSLGVECPNQLFKGNAIPMGWDFAESNIVSRSSASIVQTVENIARNVESTVIDGVHVGEVSHADATRHPLSDQTADIWFTDPPYYDAVPYADLSDFFFVWLKRALSAHPLLRDPFDPTNRLSPKAREIVQDETKVDDARSKDSTWFEERMAMAFNEGRRVLNENGIGSVVFAHKTTQGWEALLSGMVRGGWTITGSWPIATERYSRVNARETASLATSVHLICRPRPENAPIGDWADVLRELPIRVAEWMRHLQSEGIRGADLVFACVGPALEIYSRYSRVETPEGSEVVLRDYLEKVWEVVGREALEQILGTAEAQARNGMAGALEEDARLTALFLWTMQSIDDDSFAENGGEEDGTLRRTSTSYSLPFDVVRRFAQPLGIHLDGWQSRVIDISKGVVRLTPVRDRSKQLFGESGADSIANEIEYTGAESGQLGLFPEAAPQVRGRPRRGQAVASSPDDLDTPLGATTLDRVHAAMLLLASGRTEALRALIRAEQERGPDFLRLANALSALYPRGSDEKRLLDAMLLVAPR